MHKLLGGGAAVRARRIEGLGATAVVLEDVLSPDECAKLIEGSETKGYEAALLNVGNGRQVLATKQRKSARCMIDDPALAAALWERVWPFVPSEFKIQRSRATDAWTAVGLNERLRFLRYAPGDYFRPHYDGAFVRNPTEASILTCMIYLNKPAAGGETKVYDASNKVREVVTPKPGLAFIFDHDIKHEGALLESGVKYAIRTDVMFANTTALLSSH